ncbi:ninja-family protein 6-like [Vigna unguiculata]|uniref:ninja-family protein 6-like n=1 Tax=Vigna unguiculata TaxID=3917 RepID=UPI001016C5DE|nr:ninja-family protein 6-like [Vigna unguiculata]XP_027902649.1 ninja-family protein 6-like [Vigna unguiculata]
MERCYNEKSYTSKKIDLTLKLSPCGENAEERRLARSSSVEGEASGVQWGPYLGRSCSLPEEKQRSVTLLSPQVFALVAASAVNANSPSSLPQLKPLPIPSQPSQLHGLRHSDKGVALKIQTSTVKDKNSMVSKKTMTKKISARHGETKVENEAKRHKVGNYCSLKGDVMEILRQMPSVSATGDGPDGKRIEGFLYKYRTGQVCIVCVCHGSFLTPAEFVKHAGGKEVANPMKHITVFSNSF